MILPGFLVGKIKKAKRSKLEGVLLEEKSQDQREVVYPKWFVGDRGGLKMLKTESRRMVSRPDGQLVFMSGLRGGGGVGGRLE